MSYDSPSIQMHYQFAAEDFTSPLSRTIRGPSGRVGTLTHIGVAVTTTFTADTTPGYVRVGTSGDADAYAELDMATSAADTYKQDDATAIIASLLPADSDIVLATVAPTGGTPAGVGDIHIIIAWC